MTDTNPPSVSPPVSAASRSQMHLLTIERLDQLVEEHLHWLNQLNRTLLYGPEADLGLATDAQRSCNFGDWYQTLDLVHYGRWADSLQEIGATHEAMHLLAARQIRGYSRHTAIAAYDYDRFNAAAHRFTSAVRLFQSQLVHDICLVDPLTGAWNRGSLLQKVSEEYNRMRRHGDPCCLCMMDIDNFKNVNDRYGHLVGDHVLRAVVAIAARHLRSYDSLFRYGGEEFLFCLPMVVLPDAGAAMERVRADIAARPIELPDGRAVVVTASFGIAAMAPLLSVEENIDAADRALYRAKAAGRNQVCCEADR